MRFFFTDNIARHSVSRLGLGFRACMSFAGSTGGLYATASDEEAQRLRAARVREIPVTDFERMGGQVPIAFSVPEIQRAPLTITDTKEDRQRRAMNETSKAMRRRRCEEAAGGFKWSKIFTGKGVDVGAGGDPIQLPGCKAFDMHDGDANHLSRYVEKESLDYLHGSQVLEHMHNPRAALLDWAVCVKKGGHLVCSVPDFDLYEKCNWVSRFNPDHKSAWSMWRRAHPKCPVLIHLPTFLSDMEKHGLKTIKSEFVDTGYDYTAPDSVDQSYQSDGAEMWIEFVFQKS